MSQGVSEYRDQRAGVSSHVGKLWPPLSRKLVDTEGAGILFSTHPNTHTYTHTYIAFKRGVWWEAERKYDAVRGQSFILHIWGADLWAVLHVWRCEEGHHGTGPVQKDTLRLLFRWVSHPLLPSPSPSSQLTKVLLHSSFPILPQPEIKAHLMLWDKNRWKWKATSAGGIKPKPPSWLELSAFWYWATATGQPPAPAIPWVQFPVTASYLISSINIKLFIAACVYVLGGWHVIIMLLLSLSAYRGVAKHTCSVHSFIHSFIHSL